LCFQDATASDIEVGSSASKASKMAYRRQELQRHNKEEGRGAAYD